MDIDMFHENIMSWIQNNAPLEYKTVLLNGAITHNMQKKAQYRYEEDYKNRRAKYTESEIESLIKQRDFILSLSERDYQADIIEQEFKRPFKTVKNHLHKMIREKKIEGPRYICTCPKCLIKNGVKPLPL